MRLAVSWPLSPRHVGAPCRRRARSAQLLAAPRLQEREELRCVPVRTGRLFSIAAARAPRACRLARPTTRLPAVGSRDFLQRAAARALQQGSSARQQQGKGPWLLPSGCWLLAAGWRLLAAGLAAGCWVARYSWKSSVPSELGSAYGWLWGLMLSFNINKHTGWAHAKYHAKLRTSCSDVPRARCSSFRTGLGPQMAMGSDANCGFQENTS